MWKQSYSKVFQNVTQEDVWKIWKDVNNWHQWHADVNHCKINGPFLAGSHLTLKPKFGPSFKVKLIMVKRNESFTAFSSFLGAKMFTIYEMNEDPQGLRIKATIEVSGPLGFMWQKLVAKKMANHFPYQMEALVSLSKIHTESIRNKVRTANHTMMPYDMSMDTFSFENPENNPGFLLWQSTMNWQHHIKKSLEPHRISHTQFAIMLIAMWGQKNKKILTQADICVQSKLDKVTISKSLKDLEAKRYIKRLNNEVDSRTKLIKLTPAGKELAENVIRSSKDSDSMFFKEVQRDEGIFIDMMRRLISGGGYQLATK